MSTQHEPEPLLHSSLRSEKGKLICSCSAFSQDQAKFQVYTLLEQVISHKNVKEHGLYGKKVVQIRLTALVSRKFTYASAFNSSSETGRILITDDIKLFLLATKGKT